MMHFVKALLLCTIFTANIGIAQNTSVKASAAVEEKTGLTLERVFRDPTLYPKPGNFGEFAPDGKHFLEFVQEEAGKSIPNAPSNWSLVKKD
ncbi:MAG: hypothetical protein ACK5BM_08570, partial [Bacteroidota bacterium]